MPATATAYDGFSSLLGGMNASVAPSLIPEGQAANIVNGAVRGGQLGNRPGLVKQDLSFDSLATQAAVLGGNFQGAGYYTYPGDPERIMLAVAGRIYRATPQLTGGFYIESFNPTNDAGNNPNLDRVYMCQADDWFVIQDGQSPAILIQGEVVRRARAAKGEVPIGTFMAHGFGRLWLVNGPNSYLAGDLTGESTNAAILFTDGRYLAENANFAGPARFGRVTGMSFYDQQDTATGQGPLMVFFERGAESVNVSLPRTQWQTSQIQVEALTNIGALGYRSLVNVNGDLFFRSMDGWRSYRQARGQQGLWGQLPMSTGVRPYTDSELPEELALGSAIFFNNRLIVTCNPRKSNRFTVHEGLLSLDFDVISTTIGVSTQPPAWDGFWQTPRPVAQLISGTFSGRARAFAVTTNLTYAADGSVSTVVNGIDEILEGAIGDDNATPIVTVVETRASSCKGPFQEKELLRTEAFLVGRVGDTQLAVDYRQDGNPEWNPLTLGLPEQTTPNALIVNSDGSIEDTPPLWTVDNRSAFPPPTKNKANTRLNRRFYRMQLRITMTGKQKLDQFRFAARPLEENERGGPT